MLCTCVYVVAVVVGQLQLIEARHSLESISNRLKIPIEDLFVKFHVGSFLNFADIYAGKPVWGTNQVLQPRDGMLLLVLIQSCNPMTGRIYSSVSSLARQVQKPLSNVQKSIRRLKAAKLLVNTRDAETDQLYILLNPGLISIGGEFSGKRQKSYQHFYAVLTEENPRDTGTDQGIREPNMEEASPVFG